jgi:hypothetical protein
MKSKPNHDAVTADATIWSHPFFGQLPIDWGAIKVLSETLPFLQKAENTSDIFLQSIGPVSGTALCTEGSWIGAGVGGDRTQLSLLLI